jgi:hypothetical protein
MATHMKLLEGFFLFILFYCNNIYVCILQSTINIIKYDKIHKNEVRVCTE